jgi:hypothetical protein
MNEELKKVARILVDSGISTSATLTPSQGELALELLQAALTISVSAWMLHQKIHIKNTNDGTGSMTGHNCCSCLKKRAKRSKFI